MTRPLDFKGEHRMKAEEKEVLLREGNRVQMIPEKRGSTGSYIENRRRAQDLTLYISIIVNFS